MGWRYWQLLPLLQRPWAWNEHAGRTGSFGRKGGASGRSVGASLVVAGGDAASNGCLNLHPAPREHRPRRKNRHVAAIVEQRGGLEEGGCQGQVLEGEEARQETTSYCGLQRRRTAANDGQARPCLLLSARHRAHRYHGATSSLWQRLHTQRTVLVIQRRAYHGTDDDSRDNHHPDVFVLPTCSLFL